MDWIQAQPEKLRQAFGLRLAACMAISDGFKSGSRMASTIFHHWLDRLRAQPQPRQNRIRAALAALAVLIVFALGVAFGRGVGLPNGLAARARALATHNVELQSQLQSLQQQQKTAATTLDALRAAMTSRDSELQTLKQQQAFYAKLIGIDGDRSGLGVHSIVLTPVAGTAAWNFVATLINTAKNADSARGTLTLSVEGVRSGKLITVAWPELAGSGAKGGVVYAFKFFQQVRGSFMLPKGFLPNRIDITLHPEHGSDVTRKLGWSEAQAGAHGISVTTP
jgi:Flp pilus assembly protein TadG